MHLEVPNSEKNLPTGIVVVKSVTNSGIGKKYGITKGLTSDYGLSIVKIQKSSILSIANYVK
jgi:hypothetical protein